MGNDIDKPVLNVDDVAMDAIGKGEDYQAKVAPMGALVGLSKLGFLLTLVEPGKKAFPFHVHSANDEAFYILEGEGTYRFGEESHPIKAGDLLAAPAGGPDKAHQIINTGDVTLKYLGVSTKTEPELVEYPDSGKFLVFARTDGGAPHTAQFRHIGRITDSYDYWDGEAD